MNKPTFTIVVPFFNPGELINNSIQSINNLSNKDFEVIFVDDGSTAQVDLTYELIKNNSNFCYQIIRQNNAGVGQARNVGLNASIGQWILFLDCDDAISPNVLDDYQNVISAHLNVNLIFTNFKLCKQDEILKFETNKSDYSISTYNSKQIARLFLKRKKVILAPGTLYNVSFLKESCLAFNSIKWSEDQLFIWKCLFKCCEVCHIDIDSYNYLTNVNTSVMSSTTIDRMIDAYPLFKEVEKSSPYRFTKKFLSSRWLFGTMHTVINRGDYNGFVKIYETCNGRKAINRLMFFGNFKLFSLSILNFLFGRKAFYKLIKRIDKNGK